VVGIFAPDEITVQVTGPASLWHELPPECLTDLCCHHIDTIMVIGHRIEIHNFITIALSFICPNLASADVEDRGYCFVCRTARYSYRAKGVFVRRANLSLSTYACLDTCNILFISLMSLSHSSCRMT
jgi:hypothetical protein